MKIHQFQGLRRIFTSNRAPRNRQIKQNHKHFSICFNKKAMKGIMNRLRISMFPENKKKKKTVVKQRDFIADQKS